MTRVTAYSKGVPERKDEHGLLRPMVACDGYVMVRRKGAMPFVMALDDFEKLPEWLTD